MFLKNNLNRREFLKKSGTIGLTIGAIPSIPNITKARAKKSSIKLSLFSVTFAGVWYDGPSLTIKEFIRLAKSIGYDGVELGAKRPHLNPLDMDKQDCLEIRRLVDSLGMEISNVAAYNNFTSPIVEQRENDLLMQREQMRLASYLGVKIFRLFAGWNGVTMDNGMAYYGDARRARQIAFPKVTKEQRWRWCRECLEEAVKWAEKFGLTLALQNHKPLMNSYQDVLKMVKEISSENLKVCLDAPLLNSQYDEHVRQSVLDTGKDLIMHSHFGGEFDRTSDGKAVMRVIRKDGTVVNYPVFVETLAKIGYNGYLAYELCHQFKVNGKFGKLKDSEEQARRALEYMKNIISNYA